MTIPADAPIIKHALDYLNSVQEAYAEWNAVFDSLSGGDRDRALARIDEKIIGLERHGRIELHNILCAFGYIDKPIAY